MASVGQIIAACYYCKWTLLAICNEAGLTGWNQSRSNVCWLEGVVNKVRSSKHNKAIILTQWTVSKRLWWSCIAQQQMCLLFFLGPYLLLLRQEEAPDVCATFCGGSLRTSETVWTNWVDRTMRSASHLLLWQIWVRRGMPFKNSPFN